MIPEHDTKWAKKALKAYDEGIAGECGPYTVETNDGRAKLNRGPINEKMRPSGTRIRIIGPDVLGSTNYVNRLGWKIKNYYRTEKRHARVIPDGQAWRLEVEVFPENNIVGVA
jgi:hypothetical protein